MPRASGTAGMKAEPSWLSQGQPGHGSVAASTHSRHAMLPVEATIRLATKPVRVSGRVGVAQWRRRE